jgi:peptide/nickel transport system ATP-binding protein/oligopeptide transport system ATP-binding protein
MNAPLLALRDVSVTYSDREGRRVAAVSGLSLEIAAGEVLGVVGESGCGKSTLARAALRLVPLAGGTIRLDGEDITHLPPRALRATRRRMQMVFQDPFGSLNPRHTVGHIVAEPLIVHGIGDRASRQARVTELLAQVGLPPDSEGRYPHEFSGGQRQRIAIARALAVAPRLLIADEPVSALDVSIQSQIINLIADLRREYGLAMLFISHDLSVIRHVSDRVAVMYLGRVVESAGTEALYAAPLHPYTRAVMASAPRPGRRREDRAPLAGELPDPADPPSGCAFHGRCPLAVALCRTERPPLAELTAGRLVACHRAGEGA